MKELIDYQEERIKSLLNKLTEYGRFILELTDDVQQYVMEEVL